MSELKPCPLYHDEIGPIVAWKNQSKSRRKWEIVCTSCGTRTGAYESRAEAVAAWNTRATPPRAEVDVDQIAADVRVALVAVVDDSDIVDRIEMHLRFALSRATGGA